MPRGRTRGFTLVELLFAGAIFIVVVGALATMGSSGSRLFHDGSTRTDIEQRASRALDKLAEELSTLEGDSLTGLPASPVWFDGMTFDRVEAVALTDGSVVSRSMRVAFEYEAGEVDDGLDNNGNGLADEGVLALYRDWGTPPTGRAEPRSRRPSRSSRPRPG